MRALLPPVALLLIAAASPGSAETWRVHEGGCGDWRAYWDVEQEQSGVWAGRMEESHVGGSCAPRNNQVIEADVRASIAGQDFFATRTNASDGNDCNYFGRIEADRVQGYYMCARVPGRYEFSLRFPAASGDETRAPRRRAQDEFDQDDRANERDRPRERRRTLPE